MTGLIIFAALVGLAAFVLGIYLWVLAVSTMRAHKRAMDALVNKIETDRLRAQQASVLGGFPHQQAPGQETGR